MNKFDHGIKTIEKLDNLAESLGPQLVSAMQSVFGANQTFSLIEKAYQDYPMMTKIGETKSDEELLTLYQNAAANIAKINESNFRQSQLEELSQKIYDASYGFIEKNPELNNIHRNWENASVEEHKHFCNAILDNLSHAFNVPRPNTYFQTDRTLPATGFMYGDTMFLSIDKKPGITGLIIHEFTHHLQQHGKTPMGRDAYEQERENYIISAFLPADKGNKFKEFVTDNIYRQSLIEREAIFTGDWTRKHFKEKHNTLSPVMLQKDQNSL